MSGVELLAQLEMAAGGAPVVYKDATNTSLDTGLCVLFDTAPLDPSASKEAAMLQSAEENTQLLIRGLFMLPSVEDPLYGPTATLPPRTTPLPRAMPPPQAKPPTRWEKFAQEKGIAKKGKRSRMVLDEPTGEYKPRFGYKRARDESSEWLYELKGNDRGAWAGSAVPCLQGLINTLTLHIYLPWRADYGTHQKHSYKPFP